MSPTALVHSGPTETSESLDKTRRIPRPVVIAALELPEEEVWRWYLRIRKKDINTPLRQSTLTYAAIKIGDFVRRYGFRFIITGELFDPPHYVLVTQSKWFDDGYLGMDKKDIPLYPEQEGKCEKRARLYLEKWELQGVDKFPYVTYLTGVHAGLF
ncbi:hypothetical protein L226DRAFT_558019 [Lentinus tigrinus ALCF2SS1-7]|uniref:Uncharacterized protein n=1 Tax=Lentinus tigrinus ALCF2SS1-6 TaxID=1328759 RepID=A0A5C2RN39_9APHY|nr:hypothetical protein L227DRAFT_605017 [Lentinus tigrinus ALCF2SS1-6]RPD79472.1 hypothetical protein L226DRAFT_558019 [Lentinus tigrinus ALCF2SS1-7]